MRRDVLEVVRSYLEGFGEVVFAYLYGSVARGETHPFSDLDVAVYLAPGAGLEDYLRILGGFPKIRGVGEPDVRLLNGQPPLFRYRVIREGVLLLCRDIQAHQDFVYRTLVEALELKEDLERLRRARFEAFIHAPNGHDC